MSCSFTSNCRFPCSFIQVQQQYVGFCWSIQLNHFTVIQQNRSFSAKKSVPFNMFRVAKNTGSAIIFELFLCLRHEFFGLLTYLLLSQTVMDIFVASIGSILWTAALMALVFKKSKTHDTTTTN
eukprot:Gregarina_sp_Poly_1__7061@NODE_3858_length_854_cov_21_249047_g2490_i0_p1_GENE_NODE_3858_length_854_cov_21_249047_g2490_i0NODE_3858_length_854_cov_21_249047_g2490_i0_p1_ORF_typecomplete_len124_score14_32_NODE_3858_length_854_cov_21_249047_g2490_i0206577